MTGYQIKSSPWVYLSENNTMYPAGNFVPVTVLVEDGSRIGLTDGFPVAHSYSGECPSCSTFQASLAEGYWRCESTLPHGLRTQSTNLSGRLDLVPRISERKFGLHVGRKQYLSVFANLDM
jgi:hypothetical protein